MNRPLAAITVAVAIGLSLGLSAFRLSERVPETSLDAAAAAVRADSRAGDLIVVEPWPQVGPRLRLGDLPLVEPRGLDPEDLLGVNRVHLLELEATGANGEARAVLAGVAAPDLAGSRTWPGITLTTFTLDAPAPVRFDLGRDIARVTVTATYPDGAREPCGRFDRERWVCPRNSDWSWVGRAIEPIGNEPRGCVWLHPLPRGGKLEVTLPAEAAATAPGGSLVGGFGFTDHAAVAARAPVQLAIEAGGQNLLAVTHPVSVGWRRYRAPLPAAPGPVTVTVESQDNGVAHFCFALAILEPTP